MKTKRLYYTDSNLLSFKAKIVDVKKIENKHITILEKTAFYPTSGGQQHDVGLLQKIPVIDVIDGDEIQHITESAVGKVGEIVSGQIDYDRRLKNKQQHSAQHILSQSFYRLYNLVTMSVHLGDNYGNIEFDTKELSDDQLQKAEKLSNQVISENRKVEVIFANSNNVSKYNLRKPPKRSGEIRLIQIDDFECTACGGTHVNSTAEIQLIKIISTEKIRGRTAVYFLCGQQAIDDYRTCFNVSKAISNKLTCSVHDIEAHFQKLVETNKFLKRDITLYQKELIPHKIHELLKKSEMVADVQTIFSIENRFDKNIMNQFVLELAEKCNGIAVILYNDKIIISCAKTIKRNAGDIAKELSAMTELKGGGNKNIAQLGGVLENDFDMYKTNIKEIISLGNNEK